MKTIALGIAGIAAALAAFGTIGADGSIPGSEFEVRCGATSATSITFEWDEVPQVEYQIAQSPDWMYYTPTLPEDHLAAVGFGWHYGGWASWVNAQHRYGVAHDPDCLGCDLRDHFGGHSRWAIWDGDNSFRATELDAGTAYSLAIFAAVVTRIEWQGNTEIRHLRWSNGGATCTTLPDPDFTPDPDHPRHEWDRHHGR